MEQKKADNPKPKKPSFDADYGPNNPVNQEAAKTHRLRFNPRSRCYEDEDGCLIRDEFGQPL